MRWVVLSMFTCTLLILSGCKRQIPKNLQTTSLEHDGSTREYHVALPPDHDSGKAAALVIALHGGGGTGARLDVIANAQLTRAAAERRWIVVFPEGIERGWNDGREPVTSRDHARAEVDDVGFIGALIDRMKADHNIDERRVYVVGMSNGGMLAYRLGIELSDRVAAIAAVTANLGTVHADAKPKAPVGVLVMNGTKDPLIPYNGGPVRVLGVDRGEIMSTDATVAWWARHNNCQKTDPTISKPDASKIDGVTVKLARRRKCADRVHVQSYRIEGGGHTWPRGRQYLPEKRIGRVCQDIDAGAEIFAFFARHRKN